MSTLFGANPIGLASLLSVVTVDGVVMLI